MKKIFILVITLGLVFVQSTNCFSATRVEIVDVIPLPSANVICYQEMWHYADGYWIVNSGTNYETKVTDKELAGVMNIKNYLISEYVLLKIKLPQDVTNAIIYGDRVEFEPTSREGTELSDYFNIDSFYGNISGGYLYLYGKPILNSFGTFSLNNYGLKLSTTVPLVDSNYGNNLYNIYKSGSLVGQAKGIFYASDRNKTVSTYLHPSMILNNTGQIKNSCTLYINSKKKTTSNHYVGNNTFINGGDVGCTFKYPIKVNFTAYHDTFYWDYSDEQPTDPVVPPDPVIPPDPVDLPSWRIHRTRNYITK